jgi:hypothetical protein
MYSSRGDSVGDLPLADFVLPSAVAGRFQGDAGCL